MSEPKRLIIGISGASGVIYGVRLLQIQVACAFGRVLTS